MASQLNWAGGCLCGAVRFRLASEPFDAGWVNPGDDLPRHERSRPDTRGLEGTNRHRNR